MAIFQVGLPTTIASCSSRWPVRRGYDKAAATDSPPIGTDDVLPAADNEAVFWHHGLDCQSGTAGERRLARR